VARGRDYITFSGTASQVETAMHTPIHRYKVKDVTHYANATEPSIPAAFQNLVGAIPVNCIRSLGPFILNALCPPRPKQRLCAWVNRLRTDMPG
jgi:subtilase family serine protease